MKYVSIAFKIALDKLPTIVGLLNQEVEDWSISEAQSVNGLQRLVRRKAITTPKGAVHRYSKRSKKPLATYKNSPIMDCLLQFVETQPINGQFLGRNAAEHLQANGHKPQNAWSYISALVKGRILAHAGKGLYQRLK